MYTFKQFLNEMPYISNSKKAYASLSPEAKRLIDDWETSNWINGPLEKAILANTPAVQEINSVMEPIRKQIGPKIRLYRGIKTKTAISNWKDKILESWTDDKRVAEYFAGLRTDQGPNGRSLVRPDITDQDIQKAYAEYKQKGFVKFGSKIYKRNDKHPELKNPDYYDIYSLNRNWVTDGDDLVWALTHDQEWIRSQNQKYTEGGIVLDEVIPTSRIFWITNKLNSKEFIVRKA